MRDGSKGPAGAAFGLGKATTLSWDDDRFITVDLSEVRRRLRIEAGQDKSQEARLLPLAPEFTEMPLAVPADGARVPADRLARRTAD